VIANTCGKPNNDWKINLKPNNRFILPKCSMLESLPKNPQDAFVAEDVHEIYTYVFSIQFQHFIH
jgi:hypothetical protein